MMKRVIAIALAAAGWAGVLSAADPQPHEQGIETKGYVWNEMYTEKREALAAKGDAARGEVAFEVCQGCHRAGATGRKDGSYPRLAGQHSTVLIKQMADIRSGRRDNPKMYPFADKHVMGPQEIADIAAYLHGLPIPTSNGKGPEDELARAKKLYDADCVSCHGANGEGDSGKFYPQVAGQHFKYLLREALAIRDGTRRNANPDMVKAVKSYNDKDLGILCDYMSRFEAGSAAQSGKP